MSLSRVQVSDFRCLRSVSAEFDSRFTLISGPNASGKTSFLESLYLLGRGRSFRTRQLAHLIRSSAASFVVYGEVARGDRRIPIGIEGSSDGLRGRISGARPLSLAELAGILPVQIIDPEVHRLIEEGPSQRRRFLDWGVFHVEPGFVGAWQGYQQALKQRNAALKARLPTAMIITWNSELARLGRQITQARQAYLAALMPHATELASRLLGLKLGLTYRTGWVQERSLDEALEASLPQDLDRGSTQVGPQRADLALRLDGIAIKDRISRGQQKLLAAALLLAQLRAFPNHADVHPTLLLDDPAAELDSERLIRLVEEVSDHGLQLIVTTLDANLAGFGTPGRHYRIEEGVLQEA